MDKLIILIIVSLLIIIGTLIALLLNIKLKKYQPIYMGFAVGVMIYTSLVILLQDASENINYYVDHNIIKLIVIALFISIGVICGVILDNVSHKILKHFNNTHSLILVILISISLSLHNFIEGGSLMILDDKKDFISYAIAIAIHNLPFGLALGIFGYKAFNNKLKTSVLALVVTSFSLIGGIVGLHISSIISNDMINGLCLTFASGLLLYTSFDEILPEVSINKDNHLIVYGVCCGVILMYFLSQVIR
ncbi:MAG: ZIP family metal transporter [Bacilli bacterium]|jgi:ZIP family zinc transporter|nr:ZIP family metal transporter [Bacilli bacterium]